MADSQHSRPLPDQRSRIFGSSNFVLIVLGVILLIIGFLVLESVGPRADGPAGIASPLLIVLGYAMIFFGILVKPSRNDPTV